MKYIILFLLAASQYVYAECNISWEAPIASDDVVHTIVYHDDGSGFVIAGDPVSQPNNATTCSAQGITNEKGHIGCAFVNSAGASSTISTAPFPPDIPGAPINILISVTP